MLDPLRLPASGRRMDLAPDSHIPATCDNRHAPMRVAFIIDTCEPFYHGGYENRAWQVARCLAKTDSVTIFTLAPARTDIAGVAFVPVGRPVPSFQSTGYRDLRQTFLFAVRLLKFLPRTRTFDIVDCNATPFVHVFVAVLLARRWRAKLVITAHEGLLHTFIPYFEARRVPFPRVVARIATWAYITAQRSADSLVACSRIAAQRLRQEGFVSVTSITGGVDHVGRARVRRNRSLVFIGRLVQNKRVDVLLEAFRRSHATGAADHLYIVGDGPLRRELELAAVRLGVAAAVEFLGALSEADKRAFLETCPDLFVSASLREGISLVTLEAMAEGLPVVICSKGSPPSNGATEYVSEANGRVVNGEPAEIAAAIAEVLGCDAKYRQMSHDAISVAEGYTWDAATRQLRGHYSRLLRGTTQ